MIESSIQAQVIKEEMVKHIRSFPTTTFKNKHGEEFTLHTNGSMVFISGSEIEMMVDPDDTIDGMLPLFSDHLNIWGRNELYKLGEALQKISKEERQ